MIYNTTRYLYRFRADLVRALQKDGSRVIGIAPFGDHVGDLEEMGVHMVPVSIANRSRNPLADLSTLRQLRHVLAREQPETVFNFTIKPVIYGSIAAWRCGIRDIYSMVPGLGYMFSDENPRNLMFQRLVLVLYRLALRRNRRVFFQNRDDLRRFVDRRVVREQQCVHVEGSGIDSERYRPRGTAPVDPTFLMACRMLHHKGVSEYVEAARRIRSRHPDARFMIAGALENGPGAVTPAFLRAVTENGDAEYLGEVDDVRPLIAEARAVVLPTYYREGLPRILLEGMAMARAVIATDIPGCRDAVQPGINGILVRPRDVESLEAALERLVSNPDEARRMGLEGRRIAVERFSVERVCLEILRAMGRA